MNLKELSKSYKLGTPVFYIDNGVIHSDVIVAQHKFQYAIESTVSNQDGVMVGDIACDIQETLLVVLAYSHRIYVTDKIYIPVDIKSQHKIRSITKLFTSKEGLIESIKLDVNHNSNSITHPAV